MQIIHLGMAFNPGLILNLGNAKTQISLCPFPSSYLIQTDINPWKQATMSQNQ